MDEPSAYIRLIHVPPDRAAERRHRHMVHLRGLAALVALAGIGVMLAGTLMSAF